MITGKRIPDPHGKIVDFTKFRDLDWFSAGASEPYYREYPPRTSQRFGYDQYTTDINGNRYNQTSTTDYNKYGSRDPYNQYGTALDQTGYGYDNQYSSYGKDGLYGYQNTTDKNYNLSSKYRGRYRDDFLSDTRQRRYADDYKSSRYKNQNMNDSTWRDTSYDRRRRREHDRYGDRELPHVPGFGRRHSWDAYDEMGNRGE